MSEIPGPGRGRKDHLTFRTILTYHSLLGNPGPLEIWGEERERERMGEGETLTNIQRGRRHIKVQMAQKAQTIRH